MFPPYLTKDQHIQILRSMSDLEYARFRYVEEMAGTYLAVGKFEDMLIEAMRMCDRVKVRIALGTDVERWKQSMAKRERLQRSTLGSLIKILDGHKISVKDICYLRWINEKRDYFIHRLFNEGAWPGDMSEEDCRFMTRRLLAIQLWLGRAERNIWSIFERADFVELTHFDNGDLLIMNKGIHDLLDEVGINGRRD